MKHRIFTKARLQVLPVLLVMLCTLATPLIHFAPAAAAIVNCEDFGTYDTAAKFNACRVANPSMYTGMTPEAQVKSYLYMNALADCMAKMDDSFGTGNDVGQGSITRFDLFDGQAGSVLSNYRDTSIGTYLTRTSDRESNWLGGFGDTNNSGYTQCDIDDGNSGSSGWIKAAMDLWGNWGGAGPVGFICDVGATRDGGGNCTDLNNNDFNYAGNADTRRAHTLAAIQRKVYGNNSQELTDVQRYWLYHESFVIACKAENKGVKSIVDTAHPEIGGLPNTKVVNEISATGDIIPTYYQYPDTSSDDITQYLGTLLSGGTIHEANCGAVADRINTAAYVNAFATFVKYGNADPSIPGATPSGGTTCGTATASGNCVNPDDATLDCGAGVWNWVLCSGIQLLQGAAETLDGFIMSQLNVDTGKIFNSGNTAGYKTAWNSFRVIAIAVIVIAGLIMVASQALGFEFLDAYTIRKILPRLLIAIIGISISWPLMQFIINFFDVVGYDVRSLIYAPFNSLAQSGGSATLITLGNPLALLAAGSALFFAYGPAVFTFLLTGFLALMVALLVLVVRQIAIIALVILSPLIIACYILPNTQKGWKLGVDNFLGLMAMFPIISAMIAAGHVMSAVGRTGGPFEQFVAIIAYFIPYFMLPFAFRLATGAIGTIAGLANDRTKGAFDRLKKVRSNASKQLHERRMAGQTRFGSSAAGSLYRRAGLATTPGSGALSPTAQGRSNFRQTETRLMQQHIDESLKHDNGRAANDDLANELAQDTKGHGRNGASFVTEYARRKQAEATAKGDTLDNDTATGMGRAALAQMEGGYQAKMGTKRMAATADKARALSVTGYAGNETGIRELYTNMGRAVADGRMTAADAAAMIKANKARGDQSGIGFGPSMELIAKVAVGDEIEENDIKKLRQSALDGLGPGEFAAQRKETVMALAPQLVVNLNEALAGGNQDTIDDALADIGGKYAVLAQVSPQNAKAFADLTTGVMVSQSGAPVDSATPPTDAVTVRALMDAASKRPPGENGKQRYLERSKEYQTYADDAARRAAGATGAPPGSILPPGGGLGG